jgi:SulP family sulfate permease
MIAFTFRPKLFDAIKNYSVSTLVQDVGAGLTVGVVALPLAMAFAIASGLTPQAGLFTSIVAGVLISALGGSRVQIGGPAGAFIVIVYAIVKQYGLSGLVLATMMSGVMLYVMGLLHLGTLIRFIPVAVVIGFTNAIAVLIMISQVKDFLGLDVINMPADFLGITKSLFNARESFNLHAFAIAFGSLLFLFLWQWWIPKLMTQKQIEISQNSTTTPLPVHSQAYALLGQLQKIPGSIVVLLLTTTLVYALELPVQTIGTRFGGIPSGLPAFVWPVFEWGTLQDLIRPALTLAVLGAIESLLCARIADNLIDDHHNPNQELMAQGVANFIAPILSGMPATGTIARTITNIKNGAQTPVAGIVHACVLLLLILVAAPLAFHIPLAALSAILMFVAWNMGEWREFVHLKEFRMPYRVILLTVFLVTIWVDLASAVELGLIGACLTFIYRISSLTRLELVYDSPHIKAQRIYGSLFFAAVKLVEDLETSLPEKTLILDFKNLIYLDSSGTDSLKNLIKTCRKKQVKLVISGLLHQPLEMMHRAGLVELLQTDHIYEDFAQAVEAEIPQNG